ncbi:MAG: hypothetical protein KatS3mg020_0034 [Fimbriimonadales bacterium]|nr:MAG: hypothetical protein KatS3mg020_0034 [Fimbriimonadales bacterium]
MLRRALSSGLWVAYLLSWGQSPVAIQVQPLLSDYTAANGAFPIAVQLESRSGNYQGVLSVELFDLGSRREYLYPVDLPAGSRKVIIATPIVRQYADHVTVRFRAPGVNQEVKQRVAGVLEEDQIAVFVGDQIGGLQILRQVKTVSSPSPSRYSSNRPLQGRYVVAYCRPEWVPEQVIGLTGVQVILLGAGAERLRAEQWNALRQWVLMGGVLIVPGGAGAVYLQNPALRELLPVAPQGTRTMSQLRALGSWIGAAPPIGAATITQAVPKTGDVLLRQDGAPLIAARFYGLGAILFLAFNPLEMPLREYNARARLWQKLLNQTASFTPGFTIAMMHRSQSNDAYNPLGRASSETTIAIKPPSAALIIALLGVYFILVVPVNYLALKRLRALDWAWVVTPLIALIFVGILWRLAGDLYRKPLSSYVQTLVVAQAGSPEAYTINSALFFFPRAGLFDLQFDQSDMVEAGLDDYNASPTNQFVRTVQGEPTRVEDYRVTNLSFQWLRYTRAVRLQGFVDGVLRLERRGEAVYLSGTLHNRLPYDLREIRVLTPFGAMTAPDLPARQSVKLDERLELLDHRSLPNQNPYDYETPDVTAEMLAWMTLQQRAYQGIALLYAQASEPMLSPKLDAFIDQAAQVSYLINLPLEGAR